MISKEEGCVCAVQSHRLDAFVFQCLTHIKELSPCCRSLNTSLVKEILVVEDTTNLRLLCYARKVSCPLCCLIVEYCVAVVSISCCLSQICKICCPLDPVLGNTGVVVLVKVELLFCLESRTKDVLDVTAFPLDVDCRASLF